MAIIKKKSTNTNTGRAEKGTLLHPSEMSIGAATMEKSMEVP